MADLLGYAASCAVLASFLMRNMVPLRVIAILSNILFLAFGYIQHIYPVFFLHMVLLPINAWRLMIQPDAPGAQLPKFSQAVKFHVRPRQLAFWFVVGLIAGVLGSLGLIIMASVQHV